MASTVYSSLPTHIGPPANPLLSRRLADNKRLLAFLACVAVFGLLGLAPSSREYATNVWKEGGVSGLSLAKEDEVLPYGTQGKKWEGTPEEAELRRWKWQAETDESLKRVLASLTVVRPLFLPSAPPRLTLTPPGRTSSSQLAPRDSPFLLQGNPHRVLLLRLASSVYLSRANSDWADRCAEKLGRTGRFRRRELREVRFPLPLSLLRPELNHSRRYGELLEEWHTGRKSLHSDGEKWQKAYSLLHRTVRSLLPLLSL